MKLYTAIGEGARFLLHCLRSIAGNSSGPSEELCDIVFIASMMTSLAILLSDSVFACVFSQGCLWGSRNFYGQ